MKIGWVVPLLVVSLMLAAQSLVAQGGTISGKITITKSDELVQSIMRDRAMNRYSMHHADGASKDDSYSLSEEAVVYIEPFSHDAAYEVPESHPKLNQRGMLFRPLVLPVLAGTTVDFPNNDDLFHNVFSISQTNEFDLGRYPKGQKKSVKFEKPGSVSIFCDIHSYMYATILVLDNPYFATPDGKGNYTISDVPAGDYKLTFFYGRKKVETKDITVNAREKTNANFSF